jgi:PelA/Pel-15E family pectate lyase
MDPAVRNTLPETPVSHPVVCVFPGKNIFQIQPPWNIRHSDVKNLTGEPEKNGRKAGLLNVHSGFRCSFHAYQRTGGFPMPSYFRLFLAAAVFFALMTADGICAPSEEEVRAAMDKATGFMMNTVSTRGGFCWRYTPDLSEQWGEPRPPARKTMIWVQDPGTVGVGEMLLDAWQVTGDRVYLDYAKRVANALIWGQHPAGGWHYFIDFDMTGVQKWYDEVGSTLWGMGEYNHYYGNCTYDDDVTMGASRYLLHLYMATLDPAYRTPLLKAMDFILESQYPLGGWPQRYPLKYDYPVAGHADYTSFYTFNDNVILGNIFFLLEAWEKLGNEEYKKAAYRGMDFVLLTQLPKPQAGWGQQYDMELRSAPAREYEPASVMPGQTVQCIRGLETFYTITGDRKYLRGIPDAIQWLDDSILPEGHNRMNPSVTHSIFYELGTNKPLYAHREGTNMENGRYWIDYEPTNFLTHYGAQTRIDIPSLKKEYGRISALAPEQAQAEYREKRDAPARMRNIDPGTVEKLISSLDPRGAWIDEMAAPTSPTGEKTKMINTATYIRNMSALIMYIKHIKK